MRRDRKERNKMKLCIDKNAILRLEPTEAPQPTDTEVTLRVKACGICGSDIPRVFMNKSYFYPIVLGHEFAGVVENSKKPELIGKRACVFPILPCGKCEFCAKEQWANCVQYDYYGSRRDGGMQDHLLVKEENLIFLPDSVSDAAGSMIEPAAVCLHAVKKLHITSETVVTVYGAGTIGLLSAMWARAFGAKKVYVSDVDAARLDFARTLGFEASGEETPDAVIEASGAPAALNAALERIRAFGELVLVGNAERDVTLGQANYSKLLRKQLTLCGSWNADRASHADDWKDSIAAIAEGKIDPEQLITHRFPLSEATKAFELIGERKTFYNKITLVTE